MATGTVNSGSLPLNKRSGPGTGFSLVGSVANGTTVTITCQAHGDVEDGPFGKTDLWDRLPDGSYVSDAFVDTKTMAMVAPLCPGSPGGSDGIQQRLDQLVSDWDGKICNKYDTFPEQCVAIAETWVIDYLHLSQIFAGTAIEMLGAANPADYEKIDYHPGLVPSPGDLVVFRGDDATLPEGIGNSGHVDVFLFGDANGFTGFDQNWGSPRNCRKVPHDYAAVAGLLHPTHLG